MWPRPAVRCAGHTGWCERPHRRWSSKSHAWRGLPVVWSSWGSSSLTHSVGCSNHIMPQVLPYGLLRLMCMEGIMLGPLRSVLPTPGPDAQDEEHHDRQCYVAQGGQRCGGSSCPPRPEAAPPASASTAGGG